MKFGIHTDEFSGEGACFAGFTRVKVRIYGIRMTVESIKKALNAGFNIWLILSGLQLRIIKLLF